MTLNFIDKELVKKRLTYENPWWSTGKIDQFYGQMKRRLYFERFKPLFKKNINRAIVLMGPRRVGKTVMLFHSIDYLINIGIDRKKILFVSVENPTYTTYDLESLLEIGLEIQGAKDSTGWYIFFDEIQYLKNWEVHLKSLVDRHKGCNFVVSGSAAAALKLKSSESGAGRFSDFLLPPLTFHEYINILDQQNMFIPTKIEWDNGKTDFFKTTNISRVNELFVDYINYGGYPEVIFSEEIRRDPERYIRHDIIEKVLLRDLPSLYGIRDPQELNTIFTTLAYNTGGEISIGDFTKKFGEGFKTTLKKYLEYLEAAFLIQKVNRIDDCGKRFKRDVRFKIYLTNSSLRSALFSPVQAHEEKFGDMVETAIFSQWMHRENFTPYYANWGKGEVDMVQLHESNLKPQWALEIKWSNRYFKKPSELKSIRKFCTQNELSSALVTTKDQWGGDTIDGINIHFIPAALYAYTVGYRTLQLNM